MSPDGAARWTNWFRGWLAVVVLCALAALAWYGYRAATEWQESSAVLVERRGRDLANLLATALTRDMRGSQVSVLGGPDWNAQSLEPPYEIDDVVATAFARYPYPECFFAWRAARSRAVMFFTRADRPPRWAYGAAGRGQLPRRVRVRTTRWIASCGPASRWTSPTHGATRRSTSFSRDSRTRSSPDWCTGKRRVRIWTRCSVS